MYLFESTCQIQLAAQAGGSELIIIPDEVQSDIDKVMAMAGGQVQAFGPKEEVLRKVLAAVPAAPKPQPGEAQQAPVISAIRRSGGPELRLEAN